MNREKLIEVLGVQTVTGNDKLMVEYLFKELNEIEGCAFEYKDDGNIYVTKGEADFFPCVVAHMDTVHKIVEDLFVLQVGHRLTGFNRITMEQTGIGGDDKVGIFIALECLKLFDNIKVAFFCDEECGCFGSYDCDMSFFDDCGFVLQCDRQGNKDFIHNASGTPLSSKPFRKAAGKIMKQFGYKFENGMMTDVMALKENGLNCSCANMSCGYYRPHTSKEYVDMKDVENCLDMVKQMIVTMGGRLFEHQYYKPQPKPYKWKYTEGKGWDAATSQGRLSRSSFDDWGWDGLVNKWATKEYCECCCESAPKVTYIQTYGIDMCDKCIGAYIDLDANDKPLSRTA